LSCIVLVPLTDFASKSRLAIGQPSLGERTRNA
jgi:hypothetical protein